MPLKTINNNDNLSLLINLYTSLLSQGSLETSIKKEKIKEFILFLESSSKKSKFGDLNVWRGKYDKSVYWRHC